MCEWLGRYELGDVKIFILNQVEVLYSKTYRSIWVTFRVNERVKDRKIPTFSYFWDENSYFFLLFYLSYHFQPCTALQCFWIDYSFMTKFINFTAI